MNVVKEKKISLCLQVFQIPPKIHFLNFKLGDNYPAPPTAQQSAASQRLDPGLSPCTRKATDPKAPTLHLQEMLIQTKQRAAKSQWQCWSGRPCTACGS